jgi:hypothetical protein
MGRADDADLKTGRQIIGDELIFYVTHVTQNFIMALLRPLGRGIIATEHLALAAFEAQMGHGLNPYGKNPKFRC